MKFCVEIYVIMENNIPSSDICYSSDIFYSIVFINDFL